MNTAEWNEIPRSVRKSNAINIRGTMRAQAKGCEGNRVVFSVIADRGALVPTKFCHVFPPQYAQFLNHSFRIFGDQICFNGEIRCLDRPNEPEPQAATIAAIASLNNREVEVRRVRIHDILRVVMRAPNQPGQLIAVWSGLQTELGIDVRPLGKFQWFKPDDREEFARTYQPRGQEYCVLVFDCDLPERSPAMRRRVRRVLRNLRLPQARFYFGRKGREMIRRARRRSMP